MELRYTVTCTACERSVEINMEAMPPDHQAIGVTFTCSKCGRRGLLPTITHRSADKAAPGRHRNPGDRPK